MRSRVVALLLLAAVAGGAAVASAFPSPGIPRSPAGKSRRLVPAVPSLGRRGSNDSSRRFAAGKPPNPREDEQPVVWVERIVDGLLSPVPGIRPGLAIVYPLVLTASPLVVPPTLALLLVVFFGIYGWLGRRFVLDDWHDDNEDDYDNDSEDDDDDERPPTDLVALGAAVVTAGILDPYQGVPPPPVDAPLGTFSWPVLLGAGGTVLWVWFAVWSGGQPAEDQTPERARMDLWDREFFDDDAAAKK